MNSSEKSTNVRTRFAPSPTGYIHVGNVRAALYPWLLARQNKGSFIIRIEDTDQARFVEGATELILETLKWVGLDWDEGPDVGGDFGPYFQTERKEIYHKWAQKLIAKGLAYADPYTPEEVEIMRNQAVTMKRPFLYRLNRPDNPPAWDGKTALRFKVPEIKNYKWHDAIMGGLSAGEDALDDFILIKADGLPTYNFAHIVDDAEMKITHVLRGLEYVSSTPKYLSLYEALEIEKPVLACMPHIMKPDGKKKLGKRDGAKSVTEYRDEGILPEAMLNFIASMGWNDGTTQEIYSKEELVAKFSLDRVQRSGAKFDEKRLIWMNGQWIRRLSLDDLYQRAEAFWGNNGKNAESEYKKAVLNLAKDRLKTLRDLPEITEFFFAEPKPNLDMLDNDKNLNQLKSEDQTRVLKLAHAKLSKLEIYSAESVQLSLNEMLIELNQKPAVAFSIVRYALSWAKFSPSLNETITTLGRDKTLSRLEEAIKAIENRN